jgi:hypothetical protein
MFWHCAGDEHSEDGRNRLKMPLGQRDHRIYLRRNLERIEALKEWFDIVDEHKMLELSNYGDRLPSLAGIARAYHQQFNSKYPNSRT